MLIQRNAYDRFLKHLAYAWESKQAGLLNNRIEEIYWYLINERNSVDAHYDWLYENIVPIYEE